MDLGSDSPTIKGDKQMALTETEVQDKIEIVGDHKHIQVRTANVISRDGVEISRAFHRHVVAHTDAVKAAYAAMLETQEI
jgi:hypothetical protein